MSALMVVQSTPAAQQDEAVSSTGAAPASTQANHSDFDFGSSPHPHSHRHPHPHRLRNKPHLHIWSTMRQFGVRTLLLTETLGTYLATAVAGVTAGLVEALPSTCSLCPDSWGLVWEGSIHLAPMTMITRGTEGAFHTAK